MDFGNGFDSGRPVPFPMKEVFRYLGYRNQLPDEAAMELIEEVCGLVRQDARPQAFYRIYPLELAGEGKLIIDSARITSRNLEKNMTGCSQVILMAATLGPQVDRRLRLLGKTDVTKQVVMQSASAAYLEAYLDLLQDELRGRAAEEGWYIRPRFSPGYGDFLLEYQTWMAAELEMQKRLGIVLSDSLMMIPSKSVTALMGVSRQDIHCLHNGCEVCGKSDCAFRRS